MLTKFPWDLAPQLPWQVFTSPAKKWAVQPSFLIGEYLFITCAVLALVHALSQPEAVARRKHLLGWLGALIAGTANDMIFMALPLVDNFWQAQGTIMLTPRLPLYIPCVYICFMYTPLVAVWRLNLPRLSRAALTGLAASIFYGPYDIIGAKFLWWTWHDTDRPIAQRLLGAPIGSTMWIITFTAAFSYLLTWVSDRDPEVKGKTMAKALAAVAGLSSLIMMVQMNALQQLDGGAPGIRALIAVVILYGAIVFWGARRANPSPRLRVDRLLNATTVSYFGVLLLIAATFDPATHVSASMHQTYGPCHVEAKDIAGNLRYKFLCAQDFDEDFSFACVDRLPADGSDWYTVCGKAHKSYPRFLAGVATLCLFGMFLYSFLLGAFRKITLRWRRVGCGADGEVGRT